MATVRRETRIRRSADDVWALAGDPARLHEWFPGMVASSVDGPVRTVTTATGIEMPEEILTIDPILRRFRYRITSGLVRQHLGVIDVFDLGDDSSLVSYSTDAEPDAMALIIGGATGAALAELRRQLEDEAPPRPAGVSPVEHSGSAV